MTKVHATFSQGARKSDIKLPMISTVSAENAPFLRGGDNCFERQGDTWNNRTNYAGLFDSIEAAHAAFRETTGLVRSILVLAEPLA